LGPDPDALDRAPTRWVREQHAQQDLGFIPSFADWIARDPSAGVGCCAPAASKTGLRLKRRRRK
jgi:hypothetical protein